MPPTLASLVRHPGLKLSVLAGEDRLETPVRWAHVSELADPVPYMEGGELLLITAMQIEADDPEEMSRYVRRLVGAGVVGLGFALGVNYAEVPPALATAAKEEGLPLLGVPRRTPFIAISKAVSAAIAADQYRAVTAGFEAQRELTRAAIGAEGPAALLARLAAHVDGWAALYDVSGAVVAAAPDWAARRAARLTPDVERLRSRPGPASIVVGGGCGPAGATGAEPVEDAAVADLSELQSLGTGRRTRGVLAVGTGAPLGTAERYAVHSAVALLTLTTERSRALQEAEQRLGAAVLRMLLAGEPDHARAVAGRLYGGLLDAPFRMLVAEVPSGGTAQQPHAAPAAADEATAELPGEATTGAGEAEAADPLGTLIDTMEAAAARIGESVLVVPDGERLIVLAPDGGAAVAAGELLAQAVEAGRAFK
ncbi:PucR family transcriptional regulator ligand-binding domain-containing protein, partial [Streptomyces javensis]|uniref:PucR family transcriptional regulator ligand-binding domain-containing protein n=1 Tax=Streptomyces javensis TaxID=114698 RepID=UPI0031F83B8E